MLHKNESCIVTKQSGENRKIVKKYQHYGQKLNKRHDNREVLKHKKIK